MPLCVSPGGIIERTPKKRNFARSQQQIDSHLVCILSARAVECSMTYTSITTHEGGMRCCTVFQNAAHSTFSTDVDVETGGLGEEPSPGDALAAVVASCMLSMIAHTGKLKRFDTNGIQIYAACGEGEQGIGSLHFDIHVPMETTPLQRRLMEAAVRNCPVGNSIHPSIPKRISWHWQE